VRSRNRHVNKQQSGVISINVYKSNRWNVKSNLFAKCLAFNCEAYCEPARGILKNQYMNLISREFGVI